jgi:UDP-3-O-[3-hydroxymyristoyl] glucosamine N-acyltransferase
MRSCTARVTHGQIGKFPKQVMNNWQKTKTSIHTIPKLKTKVKNNMQLSK